MEDSDVLPDSSFYSSFTKILAIKIPENQPAILFKYKTPEKKIVEDLRKKKEQKHKKLKRLMEKKKNYNKKTDVVREKSLRKTALKGVIKIFNEIASAQTKNKEKKEKEGAVKMSERFKRRMKRITETTEARKMVNYSVEKPKWNVLSEDYLKSEA